MPTLLLTLVVLACVALVLLSRRLLGATGTVDIELDDGQAITSEAGRRLLWVLEEAGIHLAGACGGKGTCGQCRVRIDTGRPPLSQMGAEHINARDAEDGYRLACMVRTWQDMHVVIDAAQRGRRQWICEVSSSRSISPYLKELVLRLPEGERIEFRAGDYVQVAVPPYRLDFADISIDPPFDLHWQKLGLT
ncbi:MAG: 2Fe-2S iron-sulfur cluster binding domain-containing protein, partial [Xanthomonadales bacterium]|nr:2Fe-2S iron-sulfur cluster binding domain-containing protein [Xanthomonadales bacterium]